MSEWGDEQREKVVPSRGCRKRKEELEEGGVDCIDIDMALVAYRKSSPML